MLNKVQIIGRVGADPEIRYTAEGTAMGRLRVAATETWKTKDGTNGEHTEWFTVKVFGKLAEIAGDYIRKGRLVYVEGSMRTEKWKDKDGKDRYDTSVRADVIRMLGRRESDDDGNNEVGRGGRDSGNQARTQRRDEKFDKREDRLAPPRTGPQTGDDLDDDDIPF